MQHGTPEHGLASSDQLELPVMAPARGSRQSREEGGVGRWPCRRSRASRAGSATPSPSLVPRPVMIAAGGHGSRTIEMRAIRTISEETRLVGSRRRGVGGANAVAAGAETACCVERGVWLRGVREKRRRVGSRYMALDGCCWPRQVVSMKPACRRHQATAGRICSALDSENPGPKLDGATETVVSSASASV